jgi:putative hydrolase of the HAD superfamily
VAEHTPTVRAVIFDWGGVLTNPIIETVQAWIEADRIDKESYVAAVRPWIRQAYGPDEAASPVQALERGEVSDADFEETLAAVLVRIDGGPVPAAGLLKRMFAASAVDDDMLELVRDVRRQGLRTGLLSNSWGVQDAYPRHLFAELFDDVVISAEVGMRKPEERIFQFALGRLGLSPGECAFVDDVEGNIVAARALGLLTVHHSEPSVTRARLAELLTGPSRSAVAESAAQ